jgi:murein L,D-transpeptidase YafK
MPSLFRGFSAVWLVLLLMQPAAVAEDASVRLVVWKRQHELWVVRNDRVIRRYHVSLGVSPSGPKLLRGDGRTPVGRYYIYEKRPSEKFGLFMALSYPGVEDAERAFQRGLISADTWADIWIAEQRRASPPWDTPLGGFVGIHGTGSDPKRAKLRQVSDWTDGCIALSDRNIAELWELTPVGAEVQILE